MKMLDLSKFDKVKEEKDHVTMRHRDGIAEMRIFLKGLPKIQQEQLKRLKMAKGGKVAHYDDGTPDAPVSQDDASSPDDSQNQQAPATTININAAPAPQAPAQQPAAPSGNQPMAGTTPVQSNPAAAMAQAPVNVNPPAVPATPSNLNPDGTMNPAAVAKNTQTANQLGADINSAKAQGTAQIEQNYINQAGKLAQIDQQNLNDVKGHVDALNQYVQSNPINPNHWAENQSVPSKLANAFGLLAGGFSGGFNGTGNNPAMNFINQQIDRDISAQKDRMGQQKTVYDAYHQIYGNSVAANAATKASMLDIYNHQFNLMAAKLGIPQAQQAAMAFGANAAVEKSKLLQDAAVSLRNLPGYTATSTNPPLQQPKGQPSDVVKSTQSAPQSNDSTDAYINKLKAKENAQAAAGGYKEQDGYRIYPVLAPGAVQSASGMTHLGYLNQPKFQSQLTAADQVDKVLNGPNRDGVGGIHDLLQQMYQDTGKGSYIPSGATQIGTGAASIPYVGGAIEGGLGLLGMSGYNDFMRKRTNMISDLSTALNGLVAPTDIVKLVDENLPKGGDKPSDIETAEQQIVNGIKKALPTDELQKAGLLAKFNKLK